MSNVDIGASYNFNVLLEQASFWTEVRDLQGSHMERPLKEKVYSPGSQLIVSRGLLREMLTDLMASKELAWRLLVRNISAQYRQSIFGYVWAFIPPLFTTLIWVFLNSQKILDVGNPGMPYPLFVLTGTVLWQTFVDALNSPLKLVTESKGMLAKINFPREALILTGIGEVMFNFAIRVTLLVIILAWYRISPPITLILVPVGVLSLGLLGLMFGLLLVPLGVLYQDVGRSMAVFTQAWFFLTPVIYPVPQSSWAATLVGLNPVTPLLTTTREWLISGNKADLSGFVLVTCTTLIMLFVGWVIYRVAMPHLISRMNA